MTAAIETLQGMDRPAGGITRLLDKVFSVSRAAAAFFLVMIALLTLAQIGGRSFGVQIRDADVLAGFAMAASAFLALPSTLRNGGHIRITLFTSRFQSGARRWIEAWCLLFAIVLIGAFTVFSIEMVVQSYEFGDVASGLIGIPLWIPQVGMAVGALLLEIAFIEQAVRLIQGQRLSYEGIEGEGD
ncbi:MAG: TRAP transporter small permease [Burkholderiaceae bacterium]|nr:TRAP transporter small permease [Burkholderiaceae bacterium]